MHLFALRSLTKINISVEILSSPNPLAGLDFPLHWQRLFILVAWKPFLNEKISIVFWYVPAHLKQKLGSYGIYWIHCGI